MATNKVTLAEYGPSSVWFTSVGIPGGVTVRLTRVENEETGEFYDLDPYDAASAIPFQWNLQGTVGPDGDWSWDGEGGPTDWRRNTVTAISAARDGD